MSLPRDRYIRCDPDTGQWFGAPSNCGPWHPIPAPQSDPPFPSCSPLTPQPSAPWMESAVQPQRTLSNRLALAACSRAPSGRICRSPCPTCCETAAAIAHELATWLREQPGGSSQVADLLDGVGCHERT